MLGGVEEEWVEAEFGELFRCFLYVLVGFGLCDLVHSGFFEERVVLGHDGEGFDVWGSGLWEGLFDECGSEAGCSVFWVDDDSGDCAQLFLELLERAFPGFGSSGGCWGWVAVDDDACEFVLAFECEYFAWWWAAGGSVVVGAELSVVGYGAWLDVDLFGECALGVWFGFVVGDLDLFSVFFVDVDGWVEVFFEVGVGCCGYDGFSELSGGFLEVVGDDFCGVAVECAAEFVCDPPLFSGLDELCEVVAVFLSLAELVVGSEEDEGVVEAYFAEELYGLGGVFSEGFDDGCVGV